MDIFTISALANTQHEANHQIKYQKLVNKHSNIEQIENSALKFTQ